MRCSNVLSVKLDAADLHAWQPAERELTQGQAMFEGRQVLGEGMAEDGNDHDAIDRRGREHVGDREDVRDVGRVEAAPEDTDSHGLRGHCTRILVPSNRGSKRSVRIRVPLERRTGRQVGYVARPGQYQISGVDR